MIEIEPSKNTLRRELGSRGTRHLEKGVSKAREIKWGERSQIRIGLTEHENKGATTSRNIKNIGPP